MGSTSTNIQSNGVESFLGSPPRLTVKVPTHFDGDVTFSGSVSIGTLSDAIPAALGTAAAGVSLEAARADHVHPLPVGPPLLVATDDLPDPDTLPEGQLVATLDSAFYGFVVRRPHLEPDNSQRHYYLQAASPAFAWRYTAGANTTADRFGRYDPITGLVYPITSLTDIPNCIIGTSVLLGASITIQRIGRAISQPSIIAGQSLVPGQRLTYNATGQMVAWTVASTTKAVGFYQGLATTPSAGSLGTGWTSYLPFV